MIVGDLQCDLQIVDDDDDEKNEKQEEMDQNNVDYNKTAASFKIYQSYNLYEQNIPITLILKMVLFTGNIDVCRHSQI